MEPQWPLILFTTFVAWSAGVFGAQAVLALRGGGARSQTPALATSMALLALGGVSVFFHLEHWERIFNGFGHLTSGITQELIAIVAMAAVALAYFAALRRSGSGAVPAWLAVCALVISAVLVCVMAMSYMMDARPAWDSFLWMACVLGNACVLGPLTMAAIMSLRGEDPSSAGLPALVGAVANAVATVAYAVSLQLAGSAFSQVGLYFDPTRPTKALVDASAATDVFAGELAPLVWVGVIAVGAVLPVAAVLLARLRPKAFPWKLAAPVALAAALAGAVCMRVVFYELGFSAFMFY